MTVVRHLKKKMINRFLIAYKRVTELGRLPLVLIALWSPEAATELSTEPADLLINSDKSCAVFTEERSECCMDTTSDCLFVVVLWQLNMLHFHNSHTPNYTIPCQTFYL